MAAATGPRLAAAVASVARSSRGRSTEEQPDVTVRLEELHCAITSALRVNKHLNTEVEAYVASLDRTLQERDAWQDHAQSLARQLAIARKLAAQAGAWPPPAGAGAASPADPELDRLSAQLERLPAADSAGQHSGGGDAGAPSTSGFEAAVELSPGQQRLLDSLLARGRAAGWLVNKSEIVLGPVLGRGVFGVTHRATWRGTNVAVKLVRTSKATELTSFLREVESLAALRHPHVLPFLGAVMQAPDHFWLLSELQPGGTLSQWLYPSGVPSPGHLTMGAPRPFLQRLQMAYEVSQGMQALESCKPPVLHRDLKPSNIFVDAGGHARLGDFGLARRLSPGDAGGLTGETGTYLYMAPEVMRHDVYGSSADVWSWGVMLVELINSVPPYSDTYLTPVQVAMGVSEENLKPVMPSSMPTDLQVLAQLVLDFDPENRPSFATVNEQMAAIMADLQRKPTQVPANALSSLATTAWNTVFGRIYANTTPVPPTPVGSSAVPAGVKKLAVARV